MGPGDERTIRRGMIVKAFGVNHGGGALGFVVIESRHKLKREFADRTGPQLVELKKQGVQIEYEVRVPLICYLGDTAVGRWLEVDEVRSSHIVLLECTFYDEEHIRRARQGKHLHVRDLAEVMSALQSRHVVLTHVTRRTSIGQAKREVHAALSDTDQKRIEFLMERPRRKRSGPVEQG
jgi:ribonuclease Z